MWLAAAAWHNCDGHEVEMVSTYFAAEVCSFWMPHAAKITAAQKKLPHWKWIWKTGFGVDAAVHLLWKLSQTWSLFCLMCNISRSENSVQKPQIWTSQQLHYRVNFQWAAPQLQILAESQQQFSPCQHTRPTKRSFRFSMWFMWIFLFVAGL